MMDDCQDEAIWSSQGEKDQHKRQRPLLVGSFLLGLGLCCLFFVYPAMMIADMEAEEKAAEDKAMKKNAFADLTIGPSSRTELLESLQGTIHILRKHFCVALNLI